MAKFIGTLAFLIFIVCTVMLIASVFNRRSNRKIWIIATIASLLVLIVSYYIDISINNHQEETKQVVEQYNG